MYSEEETELRDLIMQNLENCGFLNKIKAEIRAGVFLALEEDGNLKNKIPLFNQKFDDFISTTEGKLIVSIIREFLVYYSLNFTLSIFEPEVASPSSYISRSELCDQLNMKALGNEEPVLVTLLKGTFVAQNRNSSNKSSEEFNSSYKLSKSASTGTTLSKDHIENLLKHENDDSKKKMLQSNVENDSTVKNIKSDPNDTLNASDILSTKEWESSKVADAPFTDIFKEKDAQAVKNTQSSIFKEQTNLSYKDPFFDDPVPTEKTSFFSFETKEKFENSLSTNSQRDLGDSKKSSLTSLKDLPSLTVNHEWKFTTDKSTVPNLDSLKSISSSEASNEEIINLDPKDNFEKKDSDVAESNEESSEKQNSESTEEEIEEDFSANIDDLYNNSLSLAEDETTDQTVSQVSVVEGVDHVEPCK